jgi:dTDP-4-dehydrorhamnose 3,5-epimerase
MRFEETPLKGAYIITLEPQIDERGFFVRSFCKKEMENHELHHDFVQNNLSHNLQKGTLRGLHYQTEPYAEVKIVSCLRGAMFDVIVDMRKSSATYGKWHAVELVASHYQSLYIPEGFAHGFQTLLDDTDVLYLMGNFYHQEAARGIRFDDARLNISWPLQQKIISSRDQAFPGWQHYE